MAFRTMHRCFLLLVFTVRKILYQFKLFLKHGDAVLEPLTFMVYCGQIKAIHCGPAQMHATWLSSFSQWHRAKAPLARRAAIAVTHLAVRSSIRASRSAASSHCNAPEAGSIFRVTRMFSIAS